MRGYVKHISVDQRIPEDRISVYPLLRMPITKSAKKALRQSERRRVQNLRKKRTLRALIKEYRELLIGKKKEEARAILPRVYKALDKATKRGRILKSNTASRLKSRLTKALAKL